MKKKKSNKDSRGRQVTQKAKGARKTVIQDEELDKLDKASAVTIQRSRKSDAKSVAHDPRRM
jgi:hypothetical protein